MKKAIATALMAAMMTVGTVGASFAAGLGTIDMAALLQKHPNSRRLWLSGAVT